MNEVTLAILGCGKQAPKHISGYRALEGVDVVVADIDPERSARLARQENVDRIKNVDDVFEDGRIDAIDICTPTPTHTDLALRSIESGKDVFCEKPLTTSLSEARRINRALDETGRIGMVGYLYRYVEAFETAKEIFDRADSTGRCEALGRIVTSTFRIGGRGSHRAWKHSRADGGGVLREMMVHMLDLVIWYFGQIARVEVLDDELLRPERRIGGKIRSVDANDYLLVKLETEPGVPVVCQADLVTPSFTQYVEVQGEKGSFTGSIQDEWPSYVYCTEASAGWPSGKSELTSGDTNLFETQAEEFIAAIRTREPPARNRVKDSVRLMEAVEMIEGARS